MVANSNRAWETDDRGRRRRRTTSTDNPPRFVRIDLEPNQHNRNHYVHQRNLYPSTSYLLHNLLRFDCALVVFPLCSPRILRIYRPLDHRHGLYDPRRIHRRCVSTLRDARRLLHKRSRRHIQKEDLLVSGPSIYWMVHRIYSDQRLHDKRAGISHTFMTKAARRET